MYYLEKTSRYRQCTSCHGRIPPANYCIYYYYGNWGFKRNTCLKCGERIVRNEYQELTNLYSQIQQVPAKERQVLPMIEIKKIKNMISQAKDDISLIKTIDYLISEYLSDRNGVFCLPKEAFLKLKDPIPKELSDKLKVSGNKLQLLYILAPNPTEKQQLSFVRAYTNRPDSAILRSLSDKTTKISLNTIYKLKESQRLNFLYHLSCQRQCGIIFPLPTDRDLCKMFTATLVTLPEKAKKIKEIIKEFKRYRKGLN